MISPQTFASLLAAALLGLVFVSWRQDARFESSAAQAVGTVTGYEERATRALLVEEVTAFPVIEFTTSGGAPHRFESAVEGARLGLGADPATWVGREVGVEYDPAQPDSARASAGARNSGRMLLAALALALLAVPRLLRFAFPKA